MQREIVMNVLEAPPGQELLRPPLLARLGGNGLGGSPRVVPIGYLWNGTSFVMGTAHRAEGTGAHCQPEGRDEHRHRHATAAHPPGARHREH